MSNYNSDLIKQATEIVQAQLDYPIDLLKQLRGTDMPILLDSGVVYGPALDNFCVLTTYPDTWTGIATGSVLSGGIFWFLGRCPTSGERTFVCLGKQTSVAGAIDAAIERVYLELAFLRNTGHAQQTSHVA